MSDTLIWISGATGGIGLGLAQTAPFPGARIINLSRRDHPDYETVQFDLTQPDTYAAVGDSFARELANFKGRRAIFIHNALYQTAGFVAEADPREIAKAIQANAAAPLVLGDLFLRAVKPGYESGLGPDVVGDGADALSRPRILLRRQGGRRDLGAGG